MSLEEIESLEYLYNELLTLKSSHLTLLPTPSKYLVSLRNYTNLQEVNNVMFG